jgi:hypothetical protein
MIADEAGIRPLARWPENATPPWAWTLTTSGAVIRPQ